MCQEAIQGVKTAPKTRVRLREDDLLAAFGWCLVFDNMPVWGPVLRIIRDLFLTLSLPFSVKGNWRASSEDACLCLTNLFPGSVLWRGISRPV